MVNVNTKMTTNQFLERVAKIYSLKQKMICVTYMFAPNPGEEKVKIEIEEGDEYGLQNAIRVLPHYAKLTVELKLERLNDNLIIAADGQRRCRSKEVLSEQLKREMGLHMDDGRRKRCYLDSKWTAKCDSLMEQDSRFLLEFDKVKKGMGLVLGNTGYLVNPFQIICPVCCEMMVLGNMNQIGSLIRHIKDVHYSSNKGRQLITRLSVWNKNHFITQSELDAQATLPSGLMSLTPLLQSSRVRSSVLARDIS